MRKLLEGLLLIIYYFWSKTLRIRIINDRRDAQFFYVFWHAKFFPLIYTHRKEGIGILVSQHEDAGLLVRTLKKFGFYVVRGSSTRGGVKGTIGLKEVVERGYSIALTPDGPKGPRNIFKKTSFKLLNLLNIKPVFIGIACKKVIRISTWDRFEIPLPFTGCIIYMKEATPTCVEEAQEILENVNNTAEQILNGI